MASSKVMASSTSTNPDLTRQSSTYSLTLGDLQNESSKNFGSMSMDELIRNIYDNNPPPPGDGDTPNPTPLPPPPPLLKGVIGNKTVDEVWKEINGGDDQDRKMSESGALNEMTLEEYLTKAGAVREEDMKIPQMVGPVHGFVVDPPLDNRYPQQQGGEGSGSGSILWLGNGGDRAGGGRGKRRAVLEPIDKVAQQRQRRMIKNRESAARSRERKQAYTVELETLVTQLEAENARLQLEQVGRNRERCKQLMENLIPVEEKRKPQTRQVLRRSCSAHW